MKRPLSSLPSLCLEKIFWTIYNETLTSYGTLREIRNTLFNCLLVNRDFCRHVIPILWRSTFNWYLPSDTLVKSYLCFLSPEARFTLSQRLDVDICELLDSCSKQRPFFNYASYLRELEYHGIFKSVQKLWKNDEKENYQNRVDQQLIIVEELCKMFLVQCPTLYRLDLATDLNFINPFKFNPISSYHFSKSCLIKLKEFKCSDHPDQLKIFNTLSNICHNIEIMQLGVFHHNVTDLSLYESIRNLIISQKYLRKFICSFAQKGFMSIIGSAFPISLQDVTLHACDFLEEENPFISFVDYYNLSSLTLIDCKNLQGSHFSPLTSLYSTMNNNNNSTFTNRIITPKREHLRLNIIYNDPIQYFNIESIISHNNIILTELLLSDVIQPDSFINHISTHCPNLTRFKANISASILPQIPLLFKSLKKLEIIELNNEKVVYEDLIPIVISDDLAMEISKSIPNSLYKFTFLLLVVFTSQSLSLFLEKLDERSIIMNVTDEYVDIEMRQVIFDEFYVRVDIDEWYNDKWNKFGEFECTRYLDDRNSRLVPTFIED